MKIIKIDDELYQYIASQTTVIGEEASDILRRLLGFAPLPSPEVTTNTTEIKPPASTKNVFDIINREELAMQKGVVGRFLHILNALYRLHRDEFQCVLDIRGRNRLYFAKSEKELLVNGSSTNPKQIGESPYWVITNSNSTKKKLMITDVAFALGYTADDAEKIRDML